MGGGGLFLMSEVSLYGAGDDAAMSGVNMPMPKDLW